ncbi:hypothetical protein [Streptomyces rochei]|uniref:hypothetical protein n=1 Tax=Streptomyces rochei TaxID=1928 RepID=UPI0036F8F42D
MTDRKPIIPSRVIPSGQQLPAPVSLPPPPAPPAPPPPPDWWHGGPPPAAPPPPVPVDVHVTVTIEQGGWLAVPEPEPGPRWWQRIRWGYNAALAFLSLTLAGPWGALLASVRDEESLAGAWVMAAIPLVVLGVLDNARRVEALHADPDLWLPKFRAASVRFLLWAAVLGTVLTLPITTLVYALTGVKPA